MAMEPYRRAAQLRNDFGDAVWALRDDVRFDGEKQLLCLRDARTDAQRWRLGDNAKYSLIHDLPERIVILAALDAIQRDLDTEPPIARRVELVGMMLDVQGITADLCHIQYLAWKLGDCPRRKMETRKRSNPWFSLVTVARTIDEVLTTLRPECGRPVPVADVLDTAGRNASALIGLHHWTINLNNTIVRLQPIVDATRDAKRSDGPEPAVAVDHGTDIP
jgi:hypothetical protein